MGWNSGAAFEDEIKESVQVWLTGNPPDLWLHKIPDTRMLRHAAGENFVSQKNIADFWAVYRGIPLTVEAKSSHQSRSFPLVLNIKEHQLTMPIAFEAAGGQSWFLINNRSKRGSFRCHAFRASKLKELYDGCLASGQKSMKWEQLYQYAECELKRLPFGMWDLAPLLQCILASASTHADQTPASGTQTVPEQEGAATTGETTANDDASRIGDSAA